MLPAVFMDLETMWLTAESFCQAATFMACRYPRIAAELVEDATSLLVLRSDHELADEAADSRDRDLAVTAGRV